MKTDKTKLLQDIEARKEKLASMEEELNKPEEFKHFPSKGDKYYYYYTTIGDVCSNTAADNELRLNAYKTLEEANKAYNKAVALEKVKRRILELQGDWKPDWTDIGERKVYIVYSHLSGKLETYYVYLIQNFEAFPYMKSEHIASTIIDELQDELKLILMLIK